MADPVIVGVSGASGAVLALKTLEILKAVGQGAHLVYSKGANATITHELGANGLDQLTALAEVTYAPDNMMAAIASGTFRTSGMIITPCSMRTLSAVAYSFSDNLLTRAADVTLKERRKLVIAPREAPLHLGHLEAMVKVTQMGGIICPPVPSFYSGKTEFEALTLEIAARAVSCLGIDPGPALGRWTGDQ
ncbi:UbiX family flavin prenyltransferase [Rhodobacteraceae bacterium RKSG542]|uniref:UbiX family flavin prenyltransferase n=1 Tax=Pseudovibrio flavus TaxID=2529854 RepID=UPI0012BD29FA|nr:UbiX family flavin prenyltransferase [Pseudovibrio flavus]MTI17710.1 UbiX family flavin prenyltransferase [Pseudovibrio flavus]